MPLRWRSASSSSVTWRTTAFMTLILPERLKASRRRDQCSLTTTRSGDLRTTALCHDKRMLTQISNQIVEVVARVAPSVVQVQGHRRAATGLVYAAGMVLTTARAVGREEHPRVRGADGEVREADVAGWDPVTRLAVLKVPGLNAPLIAPAGSARVGEIAIALARSWSNSITATAGLVSVIGGPL